MYLFVFGILEIVFPDVGPDLFYNFVTGSFLGPHNVGKFFGQLQALAKAPRALPLFGTVRSGPSGRLLGRIRVRLALPSPATGCQTNIKGHGQYKI